MGGSFIDKFSDSAPLYRAARPHYPLGLFDDLAALAPARALAWDVGTGNGQAARGLARRFERVHATDPSGEQIANAMPAERVAYSVEPAERSSLPDRSADLVVAAQSLHWFDRDLFYREAERVLKPGGVLAAIGYDWMYVTPEIDSAINRALLPLLESHWAPQNRLLWAGYRSIAFPGDEIRLGAHAIYVEWSFEDLLGYVMSWSAVRALIAVEGRGPIDDVAEALSELWGGERRMVVMPLHIRASRLGRSLSA